MKVAAIQKTSFIDYPDKIATVLFCPYCNLRCPYCHNPELVFFKGKPLDESEIFSFLKSRINKLEAVVITGGEPTLQKDIINFVRKIKALGYFVKVDTNGHYPETLKLLIDNVDVIALDIKTSCQKYKKIDGNCEKLKESLSILKNFKGELILRTTMYSPFTTKEDLKAMKSIVPSDLNFSKWEHNEYRDFKTLEKYIKEYNIIDSIQIR
jgi:pyruvate formate lyase activating enzyme